MQDYLKPQTIAYTATLQKNTAHSHSRHQALPLIQMPPDYFNSTTRAKSNAVRRHKKQSSNHYDPSNGSYPKAVVTIPQSAKPRRNSCCQIQ